MPDFAAEPQSSNDGWENDQPLIQNLHRSADRLMVGVLWLLWLVSFGFSFLFGTWVLWATVATAVSAFGTFMASKASASLATRFTMGAAFMVYSALLIHQAHGLVETHFGIFALLAFLLYYRDWRPIVLAAGLIAVHHLGFYVLQVEGWPVYVFQHVHMPIMVAVHAAYVVFETIILVLMAVNLSQETREAALLATLGTEGRRTDEIDLDPVRMQQAGAAGQGVAAFLGTISHALREASVVAVAIRQASTELRAAGSGMVEIRNHQQADVDHVVELVQEMGTVASHAAEETRRIADEAAQCSQTAQQTGQNLAATTQSIQALVQAVQKTAGQMTQLDESTLRIESIVSMIDDIAGQTNLLALNASIEAARAGEAGRGFAVVAGEVRRLSESTQNSAKQIQQVVADLRSAALVAKDVAEASRLEAEQGGIQMNVAGREFQTIVSRFPVFAESMNSLSCEMGRHRVLMDQASTHIQDISQYLQTSSGRVEDIRTSGQSLEAMSERLYASVRRFRNGQERFVS